MKNISLSILLFWGFVIPALSQNCVEPDPKAAKRMQKDVYFFADDKLEGRDMNSAGEKMAAAYLEKKFKKLGLKGIGEKGSYRVEFETSEVVRGNENLLSSGNKSFELGKDFFPLEISSNGKLENLATVMAGFGIVAPELKYDDYMNTESVSGKIVIINYSSPDGVHPHSQYAKYHDLQTRVETALQKGAAGVIVYNPDKNLRDPSQSFKNLRPTGIPVIFITEENHEWLTGKPVISKMAVELQKKVSKVPNVVGFWDNGAEKTVVIGAHYDHLGYGEEGSLHAGEKAIHNGADDNASGTAGVVELAHYLRHSDLINNNYLFIAFTGEEKGLLGSKAFVENSPLALDKVNYMINMDMIGRMNENKAIVINGVGTSPAWKPALESLSCYDLKITTTESGVGPSDHTSFYLKDIPVLHFFSGTHKDYHKPSDDADKVNYAGMTEIIAYIESLIGELDSEGELEFSKTKEENNQNAPRFTVTMGIMPDYTYDGEGMKIDGVSEGKPAQKAGIQAGDIVLKLGDYPIRDMQSYMQALSLLKRGDKTKVLFLREGKELERDIEF
ncbi:MAG: M28 family peptidase [Bacteroidia bacterium]|nr:M28 family peptidase [Bacteroidia bacterium]